MYTYITVPAHNLQKQQATRHHSLRTPYAPTQTHTNIRTSSYTYTYIHETYIAHSTGRLFSTTTGDQKPPPTHTFTHTHTQPHTQAHAHLYIHKTRV